MTRIFTTAMVPLPPRPVRTTKKKKESIRTRERLRLRSHGLELDIMNLRQEIAALQRTRNSLLFARSLNRSDDGDGSVLKTIHQFYHLLRCGYREATEDSLSFINKVFRETLQMPDQGLGVRGREQLKANLIYLTTTTGAPQVRMINAKVRQDVGRGTVTVFVRTRCSSPLSSMLLEKTFSHVSLYPDLRDRLLGKRISAYGDARFVFDLRTQQVTEMEMSADHVQAILRVVESWEDYEILMQGQDGGEDMIKHLENLKGTPPSQKDSQAADASPMKTGTSDSLRLATPPKGSSMSLAYVLSS